MKKLFYFVLAFIFFPLQAYSLCQAADMSLISFIPSVVDFTNSAQVNAEYQISHTPFNRNRTCRFFATMDYGAATSWNNRVLRHTSSSATIPFNVYSQNSYANNTIVRVAADATADSHVVYSPPFFTRSATTVTLSKNFYAQLGTVPVNLEPGLYTESLVFRVRARTRDLVGDYPTFRNVITRAIQFMYRVPKELDLSILPTGGGFDASATSMLLSFGELETGKSRAASVRIKTNVGYRLFLSSKNDGNLKHANLSDTISYAFSVNGANVNLVGSQATPVEVSSSAASSPAVGFEVPIEIQIGNVTGAESGGEYSDVVYFSIEAF